MSDADETVEVEKNFLWALQVLALDGINAEGQTSNHYPNRYADALVTIDKHGFSIPTEPQNRNLKEHPRRPKDTDT